VEPWAWDRHVVTDPTRRTPYRRRYQLDIAQGGFSTSPNSVVGTGGGAVLAFSDLLGDDIYYVTAYSSNTLGRSFLEGLNLGVTRVHLGRRASYGYGLFRVAGQRYDRADPDAVSEYPVYYEQVYGGLGLVSYPISQFRRVEVSTSIGWSRKDQIVGIETDLETIQLSNALSLVHDNALYGMNGPVDGWRANLTAGYTTDLMNSYVSYYTLAADVRRYWRLPLGSTFAQWGLVRTNVGRRARLNLIGGSWSLRGYPFLRLRGRSLWFTSQELRFPLVVAPGAFIPFLEPFAIASIRGAAFVDAAHLWTEGYDDVIEDQGSGFDVGRTLASTGLGLRVNALGGFVFRYDFGYRFPDGLEWDLREPFQQFFFGWDF
jgi:outer membrane protein assembly factor BamA